MTTSIATVSTNLVVALANAGADGTPTQADLYSVVQAYRDLDTAALRTEARNAVAALMAAAFQNTDPMVGFREARFYNAVSESLASKSAPVDPTQAFVDKVAAIRLALDVLTENVPDGVNVNWDSLVDDKVASLESVITDEESTDPTVLAARKIAASRTKSATSAGTSYSGPARSVQDHIANAMATVEVGAFLKVAEIRAIDSEAYGSDRPSSGAIQASLNTKEHATYKAAKDANGKNGAIRVA